jgi:hypothetical protein
MGATPSGPGAPACGCTRLGEGGRAVKMDSEAVTPLGYTVLAGQETKIGPVDTRP